MENNLIDLTQSLHTYLNLISCFSKSDLWGDGKGKETSLVNPLFNSVSELDKLHSSKIQTEVYDFSESELDKIKKLSSSIWYNLNHNSAINNAIGNNEVDYRLYPQLKQKCIKEFDLNNEMLDKENIEYISGVIDTEVIPKIKMILKYMKNRL